MLEWSFGRNEDETLFNGLTSRNLQYDEDAPPYLDS